jgi:hypothetical protein
LVGEVFLVGDFFAAGGFFLADFACAMFMPPLLYESARKEILTAAMHYTRLSHFMSSMNEEQKRP